MVLPQKQIEEIFYFDQAGIIRLYNQIKDSKADSFTKEIGSTNEYTGSLKPELGTESVWSKFIPAIKVASELANKRSKATKTVETHTITVEERYACLLKFPP